MHNVFLSLSVVFFLLFLKCFVFFRHHCESHGADDLVIATLIEALAQGDKEHSNSQDIKTFKYKDSAVKEVKAILISILYF